MDPVSQTLLGRLKVKLLKTKIIPKLLGNSKNKDKGDVEVNSATTKSRQGLAKDRGKDAHESDGPKKGGLVEAVDLEPVIDSQATAPEEESVDQHERPMYIYATFNGEDEDDYTKGPARMVLASDGVQQCSALLMKLDLSAKIQEAIQFQRKAARVRRHAEAQEVEFRKFEREVNEEISNYQIRVARAKEEGGEDSEEAIAGLEEKLEALHAVAERLSLKRLALERKVEWRMHMLQEAQIEVIDYLEETFVEANLIESDDVQVEESVETFDLQTECKKVVRDLQGDCDVYDDDGYSQAQPSPEVEPLETGDAFMRPDLSKLAPEQQRRIEIWDAITLAQNRFQDAQKAFDLRASEQGHELECRRQAKLKGEETLDSTQTEFDLRWVKRNRDLTHGLVEAEKQLSEAKAAARAANIDVSDQESACGDEATEFSFAIDTQEAAAYAGPRVKTWLEEVEEGTSDQPQSAAEVDGWEFCEIEIWDSISCVDNDFYRDQIDEWQRICRKERH